MATNPAGGPSGTTFAVMRMKTPISGQGMVYQPLGTFDTLASTATLDEGIESAKRHFELNRPAGIGKQVDFQVYRADGGTAALVEVIDRAGGAVFVGLFKVMQGQWAPMP